MKTDNDTDRLIKLRMQILDGIAKGEKAISEGRTFSHKQAQEKMQKWLR